METSVLLTKYVYYYDSLQKLGEISLNENPTIDDLNPTRGVIQAGYKDIKEMKFNGNLIDYLCWISTQYILLEWKKGFDRNVLTIMDIVSEMDFEGPKGALAIALFHLEGILWRNKEMAKNTARLFFKNPSYVFESREYEFYKELFYKTYGKKEKMLVLADILCVRQISKVILSFRLFDYLSGKHSETEGHVTAVLHKMLTEEIKSQILKPDKKS